MAEGRGPRRFPLVSAAAAGHGPLAILLLAIPPWTTLVVSPVVIAIMACAPLTGWLSARWVPSESSWEAAKKGLAAWALATLLVVAWLFALLSSMPPMPRGSPGDESDSVIFFSLLVVAPLAPAAAYVTHRVRHARSPEVGSVDEGNTKDRRRWTPFVNPAWETRAWDIPRDARRPMEASLLRRATRNTCTAGLASGVVVVLFPLSTQQAAPAFDASFLHLLLMIGVPCGGAYLATRYSARIMSWGRTIGAAVPVLASLPIWAGLVVLGDVRQSGDLLAGGGDIEEALVTALVALILALPLCILAGYWAARGNASTAALAPPPPPPDLQSLRR